MTNPTILLLALALDAAFGDPERLYRAFPHPVALIGRAIGWLDRRCNRDSDSAAARRLWGVLATVAIVGAALALGWLLNRTLAALPLGWVLEAILMSTVIAQHSLYRHVAAVADGLERHGLKGGREAVRHIVGRDPDSLDDAGVARAALESLAENFSDGVTAPLFWGLLLGFPGILAYKAVNTADSMIGHRTPRHEAFGWASARFDDLLNFIPARLGGLLVAGAALIMPGSDARAALHAMRRDAPKHHSPNAGWPEAALAGALGLALAGPRRYEGELVEDAWMGAGGRAAATIDDIRRGQRLYVVACAIQAAVIAAIALL